MNSPKLYILPARHAPLEFDPAVGRPASWTRVYDGNGNEIVGFHSVSIRPVLPTDQPILKSTYVCTVEMRMGLGECVEVDKPPPRAYATLEELRALVERWRAHWAVAQPQGSDRESSCLAGGIEKCADELEALIETLTARQG